jgi:hypothetical protein
MRRSIQHYSQHPLIKTVTLLTSIVVSFVSCRAAIASDQETLLLLTAIPDPYTLIEQGGVPAGSYVTADTISQTSLTIPSLWWTRDQFGGKLLETWFAFPTGAGISPRVDLVVNQQVWSLYTYLERYSFVNQFGTAAKDFGYNVRIFNRQRNLLAAYICEPIAQPLNSSDQNRSSNCNLFLDSTGQGSLQGTNR